MALIKKILVPTDFSIIAQYASDVAVSLAPKLSAEVHFYTRVHMHPAWDEVSEKSRMDFPETFARVHEAKTQFRKLQGRYDRSNVRTVMAYAPGDLSEIIADYVDKENIYLTVMGTHGASGMQEILFGSRTQKVVRQAHCPVLVLKKPMESIEFKNIVFASDFSELAKKPFEKLIDFAWHFGSHIHLLHVEAAPAYREGDARRQGNIAEFEKMCWRVPCTVHEVDDISVEHGISNFARKIEADMTAIAQYGNEDFFSRWLSSPISEKLVNHLEIPVMVLNSVQGRNWFQYDPSKEEVKA